MWAISRSPMMGLGDQPSADLGYPRSVAGLERANRLILVGLVLRTQEPGPIAPIRALEWSVTDAALHHRSRRTVGLKANRRLFGSPRLLAGPRQTDGSVDKTCLLREIRDLHVVAVPAHGVLECDGRRMWLLARERQSPQAHEGDKRLQHGLSLRLRSCQGCPLNDAVLR